MQLFLIKDSCSRGVIIPNSNSVQVRRNREATNANNLGSTTSRVLPQKISGINGTAVSIGCGSNSMITVTTSMVVYVWGVSSFALGLGSVTTAGTPTEVTSLRNLNVTEVFCRGQVTMALTREGRVYSVGYNYGSIGNNDVTSTTTFGRIFTASDSNPVTMLSDGDLTSVIYTKTKALYS
jgi:alpha-tubulin suppressor-like RCC1 family protein